MLETVAGAAGVLGAQGKTWRTTLSDAIFAQLHGNNLVYNMCWEDPRLDREAMALGPGARVLVLTSAGCNALEYLLDDPDEVIAVDLNPRQNALLELKVAALRNLQFEDLFRLFGDGWHPSAHRLYRTALRPSLSEGARRIWDGHIGMFESRGLRKTFYFRGTCGALAWAVLQHFRNIPGVGPALDTLLEATTLEEQQRIYLPLEERLWSGAMGVFTRMGLFSSMLGVPDAQRALVDASHGDGFQGFIRQSLREVLAYRPIVDNYFWRGYIRGQYSASCCPSYLLPENHERLRQRLDRLHLVTGSVTEALRQEEERSLTHFVLLDHHDWMAAHALDALQTEWQEIVRVGRPGGTVLFRSAAQGRSHLPAVARAHLRFEDALAARLHARDRVGTYASFHIGRLLESN